MQKEQMFMGIGAAVLVVLAGVRRFLQNRRESAPRVFLALDVVLFVGCFSLLAWYFYEKDLTQGLWAVGMGAIGVGKYLWDSQKK